MAHTVLQCGNSMTMMIMMIKCHCWYAFITGFHRSFATPFLWIVMMALIVSALSNAIFKELFLNHTKLLSTTCTSWTTVKVPACSHDELVLALLAFSLSGKVGNFQQKWRKFTMSKTRVGGRAQIRTIDVCFFFRTYVSRIRWSFLNSWLCTVSKISIVNKIDLAEMKKFYTFLIHCAHLLIASHFKPMF